VKINRIVFAMFLITGLAAQGQVPRTPVPMDSSTQEERAAAANSTLTKSIAEVLLIFGSLKPGMTRADILEHFTEEGGLSFRTRHTYVYRGCPYIKIDVNFAPAPGTENDHTELMEDIIMKISHPYLEWSIAD